MEFAERMLKKYGWDADKGLGKDNQGMKTAIKPVLKFDNRGVGCNQKDEYSSEYKWWEHTYNRAAKKVSDALDKSETDEAKKEKKKKRKREEEEQDNSKKSIYSRFEKSSVLMGSKEESLRTDPETDAPEAAPTSVPSDEDLLRICGGRTAHKGARHGIKMNGKLQRLQEQEARISSTPAEPPTEEKKKKKKKHRSSDETDE